MTERQGKGPGIGQRNVSFIDSVVARCPHDGCGRSVYVDHVKMTGYCGSCGRQVKVSELQAIEEERIAS